MKRYLEVCFSAFPESMRSFIRKNNLSLSLIGSSYDGVSVNDVIFNGRTAVEELLGTEV